MRLHTVSLALLLASASAKHLKNPPHSPVADGALSLLQEFFFDGLTRQHDQPHAPPHVAHLAADVEKKERVLAAAEKGVSQDFPAGSSLIDEWNQLLLTADPSCRAALHEWDKFYGTNEPVAESATDKILATLLRTPSNSTQLCHYIRNLTTEYQDPIELWQQWWGTQGKWGQWVFSKAWPELAKLSTGCPETRFAYLSLTSPDIPLTLQKLCLPEWSELWAAAHAEILERERIGAVPNVPEKQEPEDGGSGGEESAGHRVVSGWFGALAAAVVASMLW